MYRVCARCRGKFALDSLRYWIKVLLILIPVIVVLRVFNILYYGSPSLQGHLSFFIFICLLGLVVVYLKRNEIKCSEILRDYNYAIEKNVQASNRLET